MDCVTIDERKFIPLRAGPLEMLFDCRNAFLRQIRLGEREVLRGIFGAVRDANWNTVIPRVGISYEKKTEESFLVRFEVECRAGSIHFSWRGEISGGAEGMVIYQFEGEARSTFLKNRIGLCVLHPIAECAGKPCEGYHTDGTTAAGSFPLHISPHQPFKNLRGISHDVTPGVRARVSMGGDVFEMEDQRNWTDASYKTYCTPLEVPFPVEVKAGDKIRQSVTLKLEGKRPVFQPRPTAVPQVRVKWEAPRAGPSIGLGIGAGAKLAGKARETLRKMGPKHVRADVNCSRADWAEQFAEAADLARDVGAKLHAALFLGDDAAGELDRIVAEAKRLKDPVALWMVFGYGQKVTSRELVEIARGKFERFAAGTDAYFAELNRERPHTDSPAMPCYSINPQVHAFDNESLVETLTAQRDTVTTARQFTSKPVVISAVTLRPRGNPNATRNNAVEPESDPRQVTGFGAAWTLGTLSRLAPCPEVHSLTFYETCGPRGVMDREGTPFPMWHVFAALKGCRIAGECISTEPLMVDGLPLVGEDGTKRLLLAGFTGKTRKVVVENVEDCRVCVAELGERGYSRRETLMPVKGSIQVELPPESVLLLELETR